MFFISDTHFGHRNIIDFCHRPFGSVTEMDEALVENWNKLVTPQDHIYHLGDVTMDRSSAHKAAFSRLVSRLNGHKRLIMGNHDHFPVRVYLDAGFEKVMSYQRLDHYWFMHVPCHPSSVGSARAIIHGHVHNNQPGAFPAVMRLDKETQRVSWIPYINICVEETNYHPVSFDWIKEKVNHEAKESKFTKTPTQGVPDLEEELAPRP